MYNLYTSSIVSLRSRASSFSFNDHSSYSESFCSGRCPSSSSYCCCNCNRSSSIPINLVTSCRVVPINPSLPFGFRQSTLIQWPPSRRRLIVTGRDRCGYGASVEDLGRIRNSYGELSGIRDVGFGKIGEGGRKSKGNGIGFLGYKRRGFEERLIFRRLGSACEDAEAMISLLTEEVGEEFLDARERRREKASSFKKGKVRENVVKCKSKLRKGNELENVEAQYRKEGYCTRLETEDLVKAEYSRLRKQGSSGSSYYSCSDSAEYENVSEVVIATDLEYGEEGVLDSDKESGKMFSEQANNELDRYKRQEDRYFESSERYDMEVGTSAKWDGRKNYMNNLTEDSVDETAFIKGSVLNQSRQTETHVSDSKNVSRMNAKALRSRYGRTDNQVSETSDSTYSYELLKGRSAHVHEKSNGTSKKVNDSEENVISSCVFCTSCGQETSGKQRRHNSEQRSKTSQIQDNNFKFVSNLGTPTESRLKKTEGRSRSLQKSADELHEQNFQEHHIASGQNNFQNYGKRADAAESYEENNNIFSQRTNLSEVQNTGIRLASAASEQSQTNMKRQEETSTSLQTSLVDVNKKISQENLLAMSRTDLKKKSENRSKIADAGVTYVQNTSKIQQQQESGMRNSEENLVSSISSHHAKEEHYCTATEIGTESQSRDASQDVSGGSRARILETMTGNYQSASQKRSHYKESYLTERVQSVDQRIETSQQVKERVKQKNLSSELLRSRRESVFHGMETSDPYVTSMSPFRIEEIGDKEVERILLSGPSPKLAPSHQSIERDPVYVEPASRFTRQGSSHSSEGDASIYIYPQVTGASPSRQPSGIYEEPSYPISHVDLLGSAEQMDKSSLQIVGEFVEKAHEASTSMTRKEKKLSERQLVNEGVTRMHEDSTRSDREDHELSKQYSRHSSGSGTTRGPNQDMWSLHEPPQGETSQIPATPVNAVVGRSGKTLWNVLGNIVRFQWGSRSESHTSPVKSGGQSSSSGSASSEAWFSGHDPDESQGSDTKRATLSILPEPSSIDGPQLLRTPTQSPKEQSTIFNTGDDAGTTLEDAPSFSTGGISGETKLELNVDKQTSQATTSVDWSQPAAGIFRRSHRRPFATFELREGGKEVMGGGRVDLIKDDIDSTLTEVSGENVVEEGRKLLRNKQVMKERFDEWEEAYRLESEQRKSDEFFMRLALEEAKKAADLWEVPVGAVLVQDGQIIASGYNLVEDLRDSTAHAEMICIREASNVLKTWRLSGTTLYVTLEPCAMCAGAILQARIGTLVYGAPNKLLGADGSWIRLFPSSTNGEGGSESTAKPEGPVHPFHPNMTIRRGVLEAECADVMQQFFRLRRRKDKKIEQPDEKQSNKKLVHPSKLLQKMHHVFHFLFCL